MAWTFHNNQPIYLQIVMEMERFILSGQYQPGERLPAVREMAAEIAVNPNTLQKAFLELEHRGLVYTQRTAGRFITEDEAVIQTLRSQAAEQETRQYLQRMNALGFDTPACIDYLTTFSTDNTTT